MCFYEPTMNNGLKSFMLPNSNMLSPYICAFGITKVAAHTQNVEFILQGNLTMTLRGQANPDRFWEKMGIKVCRLGLAGWLGTDGRRKHYEPIEIQDPKWLLLFCIHRQMMPLCQWI